MEILFRSCLVNGNAFSFCYITSVMFFYENEAFRETRSQRSVFVNENEACLLLRLRFAFQP